jgi:hypothetical protein
MPLYTYDGLGSRVVSTRDFESMGVTHKGFYVDQGDTIELSEDAAEALLDRREAFSIVPGTEDDTTTGVPTVDDPEANVEKPAGEEPGTSVDPASPDVKSKPGK